MPNVEYRGMNLIIPENDSEWREHFKLARGHKLMLRACRACGLMRYPPTHACPGRPPRHPARVQGVDALRGGPRRARRAARQAHG
ncbi:MAG: hypothetical protein DME10_16430 [Candidatus Rokuibacteriota bacterium]|nr:MAG: hypothetical protein DME10_16430 [Candidatus Rokubacteria bacterium]